MLGITDNDPDKEGDSPDGRVMVMFWFGPTLGTTKVLAHFTHYWCRSTVCSRIWPCYQTHHFYEKDMLKRNMSMMCLLEINTQLPMGLIVTQNEWSTAMYLYIHAQELVRVFVWIILSSQSLNPSLLVANSCLMKL